MFTPAWPLHLFESQVQVLQVEFKGNPHLSSSILFLRILNDFFRTTQTKTWGTQHGAGSEFSRGSGLPWRYSVHFSALCPMSSMSDCWRLCFDGLYKDMFFSMCFLGVWGIFNGVKVIIIYRLFKVDSFLYFSISLRICTHTYIRHTHTYIYIHTYN